MQSPASVRVAKFVKYLTRLNWECVVVSSDKGPVRGVNMDDALDVDVPASVKVIRTRSFLPHKMSAGSGGGRGFVKEVLYNLLFPDQYLLWALSTLSLMRGFVKRGDIVITTLSPYSAALVGLALKIRYGTKWVMDYRDGWTTDPYYKFVKPKKVLETVLEFGCLKLADAVTCVSEPLGADLSDGFGVRDKITVIENGFDPEDREVEAKSLGGGFNIVYTGMISSRTRDVTQLIYALDEVINKRGFSDVKAHFIGPVYDSLGGAESLYGEMINRLGLQENVFFTSPVPRTIALAYQRQADALLMIYTSRNDLASVMSSKIFEYIQARKPILGLINRSAARELIEDNQLGICADPMNRYEIAEAILRIRSDPSAYPNKSKYVKLAAKYNRKNLATKLSRVLEAVNTK